MDLRVCVRVCVIVSTFAILLCYNKAQQVYVRVFTPIHAHPCASTIAGECMCIPCVRHWAHVRLSVLLAQG